MRLPIFLLLLSVLSYSGCGSNTEEPTEESTPLEGRWVLEEARRDNVKTGVLDGLYFTFGPESNFETNLLATEAQRGSYTRSGNEIATTGVEPALDYEITELDGERLLLRSRYQGFLFDFALRRGDTAD